MLYRFATNVAAYLVKMWMFLNIQKTVFTFAGKNHDEKVQYLYFTVVAMRIYTTKLQALLVLFWPTAICNDEEAIMLQKLGAHLQMNTNNLFYLKDIKWHFYAQIGNMLGGPIWPDSMSTRIFTLIACKILWLWKLQGKIIGPKKLELTDLESDIWHSNILANEERKFPVL